MGRRDSEEVKKLIEKLCDNVLLLVEGSPDVEPLDDAETEFLQKRIEQDETQLGGVVTRLELSKRLSEGLIYSWLAQLTAVLPYSDASHEIIGRLWCFLFSAANSEGQERLLSEFTTHGDFFAHLDSIPTILSIGKIPSKTLAAWLRKIEKRIADDVSAPLFNGLSVLARSRPETAGEVLECWISSSLNEACISLTAYLLAELRARDVTGVARLERVLIESDSQDKKKIYFRSWSRTDDVSQLAFTEFREIFEAMEQSLERDECFRFLCRAINRKGRCRESFGYALQWIRENLPAEPSDSWTYWLIDLSESTLDRSVELELEPLFHQIPKVLPIPDDHSGTRRRLDGLLAKLFSHDRDEFVELIVAVSRLDGRSLQRIFDPGKHHALLGTIVRSNVEQLVSFFLAGDTADFRGVGLKIFQRSNVETLPPTGGSPWNENQLARIIFQLGSEASIDFPVARLMAALEKPVRQCEDKQLHVVFVEQLVYHMKNLPGACLDGLKQINKHVESPLFREAIKTAEEYFSGLSEARESGINSIQIAGYRKAARTLANRRSREIQQASEGSNSLVSFLARKSYPTYGGGDWQIVTGGRLGDVTSSEEFSHSMEFPRMPTIDPEGYGDWRLNCWKFMQELDEGNTDKRI